jgi:hypothetical protein
MIHAAIQNGVVIRVNTRDLSPIRDSENPASNVHIVFQAKNSGFAKASKKNTEKEMAVWMNFRGLLEYE